MTRRVLLHGSTLVLTLAFLMALGAPASAGAPASDPTSPFLGREVPNFALLDARGRFHELRRAEAGIVVLYFTGNGCPVARQSLPRLRSLYHQFAGKGVRIWLVNSNPGDDRESVRKELEEFSTAPMPVLLDETQGVATMLGVRRTGTAICIETTGWTAFYQGAIDDQFAEGSQKPEASEHYLKAALTARLAGQTVAVAKTAARGCLISVGKEPVSYATQIAPILERKCFGCHSPGNIGPIKFTQHAKVRSSADMIQEVVLARRMPPWHADRHHGSFVNDQGLTVEESRLLLRWVEAGAPRGEGEDPLAAAVPPKNEWVLGQPDAVVSLPKVEEIPATGVLDYRHLRVKAPFDRDVWVKGVVAKPDNTRVVHHIIVRVRESGQQGQNMDDVFLLGWAPGTPEMYFPERTGKLIKKGSELEFEMHYTTSGREEKDQSRIGIYLHAERPPLQLKTHAALNLDFEISAGEGTENAFATYVFAKEGYLYDMAPHMHLRGAWFKFEALFPNGERETLLSVPRYDFKWQHNYRLKEPRRMPAGTWILCSGGFDNSSKNPDNPAPQIPVHWGEQSFEEMFIGFMGVSEVEPAPTSAQVQSPPPAGPARDPGA